MNGNHQDWDFGEKSRQLPCHVESVQIRHLKVKQDHIGRVLLDPLQGLSSSPSLAADLPGALLLEQRPKIVPNRRIVVYHKNSNQAALPL
jgi:hypothetical protein